jgi:hypothetical protein
MRKIKLIVSTLLILVFCSSVGAGNFGGIRKESTYWMPYHIEEGAVLIVNKRIEIMSVEEDGMLLTAIVMCLKDTDPRPRRYIWFKDNQGDLEGIVTKNWPGLKDMLYPADINEIMIDIKMKMDTTTKRLSV